MKSILVSIVAAVLVVGCSKTPPPDISIQQAAYDGNIEVVKQHLAFGTPLHLKDNDGDTPLPLAVLKGHKEIAELLIAKGANVNAKDDDGDTPLDWTVDEDHKEIADLLRKHGGKTKKELEAADK